MSKKYPVVAVTGSSGAGTTTVKVAFEHIFMREGVNPVVIEGDSYHRYNRAEMKVAMQEAEEDGNTSFSHFGPEANIFDKLEETFRTYGDTGSCERRYYLHSDEEAKPFGQKPGEFTPWETINAGTDLLFYEGLHGAVITPEVNVARYYMRRGAYIAAANRARYALEVYPKTPLTPEALIVMHKAYTKLELPELADSSMAVLELNFPDNYYVQGRKKKRSWADRLWPFD